MKPAGEVSEVLMALGPYERRPSLGVSEVLEAIVLDARRLVDLLLLLLRSFPATNAYASNHQNHRNLPRKDFSRFLFAPDRARPAHPHRLIGSPSRAIVSGGDQLGGGALGDTLRLTTDPGGCCSTTEGAEHAPRPDAPAPWSSHPVLRRNRADHKARPPCCAPTVPRARGHCVGVGERSQLAASTRSRRRRNLFRANEQSAGADRSLSSPTCLAFSVAVDIQRIGIQSKRNRGGSSR